MPTTSPASCFYKPQAVLNAEHLCAIKVMPNTLRLNTPEPREVQLVSVGRIGSNDCHQDGEHLAERLNERALEDAD